MSEKKSSQAAGAKPAASGPAMGGAAQPPAAGGAPKVARLFRRVDWWTFAITTLVTLIGYWWTLAPDLTLEDSGELAVGSYYAGVPHPPGYPVWTIYTWLFTVLFPVSNIAYRVAFSSAVAAAFSCGLVGLMVSRGSSMMIESIEALKRMDRTWENGLCMVSGFVAGMLIGFNGFMWSQAVIVEVYTLSVLSMTGVLVCLMRWIHAPQQYRYLCWAFFWFGISFNNHQSLLVIALGMEVAVVAAAPRFGRALFFWNSAIYLGVTLARFMGITSVMTSLDPTQVNPLFVIFNLIGLASTGVWIWLAVTTKLRSMEVARDLTLVGAVGYILVLLASTTNYVTYFDSHRGAFIFFNLLGMGMIAGFVYFVLQTTRMGREWLGALGCGGAFGLGAAFYLYMPLTAMTNPPLNWGYPRTVQGFFHAFTRGQYEKINPTDSFFTYIDQVIMYVGGALDEFNLVYLLIGLVPFVFLRLMQKRERAWLIGLAAIYICLSAFLLALLNPSLERQSRDLNRVFFTASHVMIAMGIGYGLTLLGAWLSVFYEQARRAALLAGAFVCGLALFGVAYTYISTYYNILRLASIVGLVLAVAVVASLFMSRDKFPMKALLIVMAFMPLHPMLSHWSDNEQRGHLFGFWFGHDMFTPPFESADGTPIYPEMAEDAILFGGTDPGRFNPTYMIFCESFTPPSKRRDPEFDRRDVYLITQNALADGTYLEYIRAHYNRSTQIDPLFFSELLRGPEEQAQNYETNLLARMMLPVDRYFTRLGDRVEKRRRTFTSWFHPDDFTDLPALVAKLKEHTDRDPLSAYLMRRFHEEARLQINSGGDPDDTADLLADELNRLMEEEYEQRQVLEADLQEINSRVKETNAKQKAMQERIEQYGKDDYQIYQPERVQHFQPSDRMIRFLRQSPASHTIIRLNRLLLEEAYAGLIARSKGGVYPDLEIHTPSQTESEKAFRDYLADAQRRLDHDRRFPNEPRQIKPGEDVRVIENRVQVSGQVAVMSINALLTKIIFDANPDHEFYVEESFPLDWMFPHLSPYGIIMKINREPVKEFTQEMIDRDHAFWSQYATRSIGNWITYETSVTNICEFAERVYIRRDYGEFQGDPKFIRDSDAQKAFSKLRSSIGGLYNYRINNASSPAEQARVIKEAEFALKQAYAFCPYSPEALFRFVQLLSSIGRVDEALRLATTSLKLDPYNGQIEALIAELARIRRQQGSGTIPLPGTVPPNPSGAMAAQLEAQVAANPTDFVAVVQLVQAYRQSKENDKAVALLDQVVAQPDVSSQFLLFAAQQYNELVRLSQVASTLQKLVTRMPDNPEAWYDLAGVQIILNRRTEALESMRKALQYSSQRLAKDPAAANLYVNLTNDPRFASLLQTPEFQALVQEFKAPQP